MTQRVVDERMDGTVTDGGSSTTGTETTTEKQDYELPQKFHGKTVDDIVASYENLEKEKGRLGNELGELRKLTDQLIQRNLEGTGQNSNTAKDTQEELNISDDDFLNNPVDAVTRIVERALKPLGNQIVESKKEASLAALRQKHPDVMETVQDKEFQDWVMSSSGRQILWTQASTGDFDVADELFTDYKKVKEAAAYSVNTMERNTMRASELESATAVSSGGSRDGTDSSGGNKTFRRADLIRLQMEDPMKYRQMMPEIMKAYSEKRVI